MWSITAPINIDQLKTGQEMLLPDEFYKVAGLLHRTDLASTESDTFDIWCQSHRPAVPNFVGLDKSEKKHFTMNETKLVNNNFSSQNG